MVSALSRYTLEPSRPVCIRPPHRFKCHRSDRPSRKVKPVRPSAPQFEPQSPLHRNLEAFDGLQRIRFGFSRYDSKINQAPLMMLLDKKIEELRVVVKMDKPAIYNYLTELTKFDLAELTHEELVELGESYDATRNVAMQYGYPSEIICDLQHLAERCQAKYAEKKPKC